MFSGSMWAAIDATLTIAEPSPAVPKKTSLTLTVPIALVRMTYSASPMLGLTPAVWITEATVPRPDAVSNSPSTASRSVTSQLTALHGDSEAFQRVGRGVEPVLPDVAEDDACGLGRRSSQWPDPCRPHHR